MASASAPGTDQCIRMQTPSASRMPRSARRLWTQRVRDDCVLDSALTKLHQQAVCGAWMHECAANGPDSISLQAGDGVSLVIDGECDGVHAFAALGERAGDR